MSILTGAELGGGLPPPGFGTLTNQTDRETETPARSISFSNEAAILQLTNKAARSAVQRGQELVDRRNEKNAAEKEEARKAAAEEARQRSLEQQGLKEPDSAATEGLLNTVQTGERSETDGAESASSPDNSPVDAPGAATVASDANAEQESASATSELVRLNLLA